MEDNTENEIDMFHDQEAFLGIKEKENNRANEIDVFHDKEIDMFC